MSNCLMKWISNPEDRFPDVENLHAKLSLLIFTARPFTIRFPMMKYLSGISFLILLFVLLQDAHAQGIRGSVKNTSGETLPGASVFIQEIQTGSSSNSNGDFSIKLPDGEYTVFVRYIGFQAVQFSFTVKGDWIEKEFVLKEQNVVLKEVAVGKTKKEDFAYTIMRKTIAKKKFHLLQYDSYEMNAYIKGTGELSNAPFFLKKKLQKEGLKLGEAYTMESVSHIKFSQPNKVDEKVISVRTKGENKNAYASPAMFINQSFYNDKVAGMISPLSRSAFAYYKFQYQGSFTEGDLIVYKIKVTPRSRGDQVFEGSIYIIDEHWAIHSLDFSTSLMGFPIKIKQNHAQVAKAVWMPVTHQYNFSGKVLGFAGHFRYLVSCNNYKVQLNKDLLAQTQILDEKVDEIPADINTMVPSGKKDVESALASDKPMTRKQYVKLLDKYEKETLKEQKEPEVTDDRSFKIDSLAGKRDSSYWDSIRPVPLTVKEEQGYYRDDSLAKADDQKKKERDSSGVKIRAKFSPADLLFNGGSYRLSSRSRFILNPAITQTNYNTVEGLNVSLSGRLRVRPDSTGRSFEFAPTVRYGFKSHDFYSKASLVWRKSRAGNSGSFSLEGGNFIEQFNPEDPIHPYVNTASSLFFRRNYMKLYEKLYGSGSYEYKPSPFFKMNAGLEWARRSSLFNQTDYSFFYRDSRSFTPNAPLNIEQANTSFAKNEALTFSLNVNYFPVQKYRKYNGRKIPLTDDSPELLLSYKKGIHNVLGSDVDYDHLQLGLNHSFSIGVADKLEFELRGGSFLNNKRTFFMDYHHFDGNQTILGSLKPAGSFRLLDYYLYSTDNNYFSGHTHYHFRKFLLTRIPEVRYMGLKENLFFNYLKTSASPHYYEAGYSLDNIFRIFRLEAAAAFVNGEYQEFNIRIGIATMFRISSGNGD